MSYPVRRRLFLLLMMCALALRSLSFAAMMPADGGINMLPKLPTFSAAASPSEDCPAHHPNATDNVTGHTTLPCQIACDLGAAPALTSQLRLTIAPLATVQVTTAQPLTIGCAAQPEHPPPI